MSTLVIATGFIGSISFIVQKVTVDKRYYRALINFGLSWSCENAQSIWQGRQRKKVQEACHYLPN